MTTIQILQILLVIATTTAISATIPQLVRLVRVKSARELSLRSYVTWSGTQTVTLMYMIMLGDLILIVANALWVTYYVTMITLIVHYRQPGEIPVAETVAVDDSQFNETATAHGQ